MSIASEITRLQEAKTAIKASINAKGGTLTDETLTEYAAAIDLIETGGGAVANSIVITEVDANKRITKVDVSSFTEIYPYMFRGGSTVEPYNYLKTVVMADTITTIGGYAFVNCTELILTSLPTDLTSIGVYAFSGCSKIALTSLPSGITNLPKQVFSGCTALALTSLPDGLTTLSDAFPNCSNLALTSLPDGIKSLSSSYVFDACVKLSLTSLPPLLEYIGQNVFRGCTLLRKIWIPISCVTIVGSSATYAPFYNCNSLLVIYCEAESKPAGWGAYWNYYSSSGQLTVNWGISKEAFDALP